MEKLTVKNLMGKRVKLGNLDEVLFFLEEGSEKVIESMVIGYDTKDSTYLVITPKENFEGCDVVLPGIEQNLTRFEFAIGLTTHYLFDGKDVDLSDLAGDGVVFWVGNQNIIEEVPDVMNDFINLDWNVRHETNYID